MSQKKKKMEPQPKLQLIRHNKHHFQENTDEHNLYYFTPL